MIDRAAGRRAPTRQAGFSMVEVLLALGLMGAVLVSITSLFIIGGKRVAQGRERTEAMSVATHIMESLDTMSYRGLYTNFSAASNPGAAAGPLIIDSRSNPVALTLGWQNLMNAKLNDARAVVTIQRVGGTDFRTARAIRTRTTIFWDDLNRTRNVTLETVRF
jgi:type II secretory pathway pseudopilin PulG